MTEDATEVVKDEATEEQKQKFKERFRKALSDKGIKQVDLCNMTGIKKGAISYYYNGRSIPKTDNLFLIAKALDVSEAWLIGFDVPMQRTMEQKNNDTLASIVVRMRSDKNFFSAVESLFNLDPDQFDGVAKMLNAFAK